MEIHRCYAWMQLHFACSTSPKLVEFAGEEITCLNNENSASSHSWKYENRIPKTFELSIHPRALLLWKGNRRDAERRTMWYTWVGGATESILDKRKYTAPCGTALKELQRVFTNIEKNGSVTTLLTKYSFRFRQAITQAKDQTTIRYRARPWRSFLCIHSGHATILQPSSTLIKK